MILAVLLCALGAGAASGSADAQAEAASKLLFLRSETVEKRLVLPTREQRAPEAEQPDGVAQDDVARDLRGELA